MKTIEGFLRKHQERVVGLDILRSVAILAVVIDHGGLLLPEKYTEAYERFKIIKIDGVSIFFVLSGFLIGGILLRTIHRTDFTKKDLLNFWIRRWFRTIPNYLFVLIGLLTYDLLVLKMNYFDFRYFVFFQNFSSPHPRFFPEAWSLCIEEWFYLLFPVFCYALHKLLKNKSQSILIAALVFLVFPLLIRIGKFEYGSVADVDSEIRKVVLIRLDSLMYGVIAAYLFFKRPAYWSRYKYAFLLAGTTLLLLFYIFPLQWRSFYRPLWFNVESITTFCFLPLLSTYKTTKFKLMDASFIFISVISYSMYLLNLSVVQRHIMPIINRFFSGRHLIIGENLITQTLLFWFLTIISSYFLYRIYELPITNLRDKIKIKRPSRSPIGQPAEEGRPDFLLQETKS